VPSNNTPQPESFEQLLGDALSSYATAIGVDDFNVGSAITSFFEVTALMAARSSGDIFQILKDYSILRAVGPALQNLAIENGITPLTATPTTGLITVTDTSFVKISTNVYPGTPSMNVGSTAVNVGNASNFPASGSIYIGRGTPDIEGPLAYATAPVLVGNHWVITLSVPTTKFHNINEIVILAQGGNRSVPVNATVVAPAIGLNPSVQYNVTTAAVILDGETSVNNVPVTAVLPGTDGNVPIGAINQFTSPPFAGATATNPLSFTNGQDNETDDHLRIRIQNQLSSIGLGTAFAVKSGVIGAQAADQPGATVVSDDLLSASYGSVLFIDDGTGYEDTWKGVGLESIVDSATGGEQFFQLATGGSQAPVAKAFLITSQAAPFNLVGGDTLAVVVGGTTYQHTFVTSDFRTPGSATAYEVISSINGDTKIGFEATTSGDGTYVVIRDNTEGHDSIQIATPQPISLVDASILLGFPSSQAQTLRLYKNQVPLSKDGNTATITTQFQQLWSPEIVNGDTLILEVDGTAPITYTIFDADFINTGLYTSVSSGNSLASWVEVFNNKLTGVTAEVVGTQIQITSNLGASDRASVVVVAAPVEILSTTGDISISSNQLTGLASVDGIELGQTILGVGIPNATTVLGISGSIVTMSNDATATTTNVDVTFFTSAGSSLVAKGMFSTSVGLTSQGATSDFTFNRNTAQFELTVPLQAGDNLAAGSTQTQARLQSSAITGGGFTVGTTVSTTGNISIGTNQILGLGTVVGIIDGQIITGAGIPAGTTVTSISGTTVTMSNNSTATTTGVSVSFATSGYFWLLIDNPGQIIPTGVIENTLVSVSLVGSNTIQYIANSPGAFLNVEVGDYLIVWSTDLPYSDRLEGRVNAVTATTINVVVTPAEYAAATAVSNVIFTQGFVVLRTTKAPQKFELPAGTYTLDQVVTTLQAQTDELLFSQRLEEYLIISTESKDSAGSLIFVTADAQAQLMNFTAGASSVSVASLIAFYNSQWYDAQFPLFVHSTIASGTVAYPPDSYIASFVSNTALNPNDPNRLISFLHPYGVIPDEQPAGEFVQERFVSGTTVGLSYPNLVTNSSLNVSKDVRRLRANDRFFVASPLDFGNNDTLVTIVDNNPIGESFTIPLYRTALTNATNVANANTFNAYDVASGPTASFAADFGPTFDFSNYKVYMQAKKVLKPSAAQTAILYRSTLWGRSGQNVFVGYVYPTVANSAISSTIIVNTGVNINISLASGAAVTTSLDATTQWNVTNPSTDQFTYSYFNASLTDLANTTNGSSTLTGLASTAGIVTGQLITGPGIQAGSMVNGVGSSTVSMTKTATATTGTSLTFYTPQGSTITGNTVPGISPGFIGGLSSTAGLAIGQLITGPGIPTNTLITAVNATTPGSVLLSNVVTSPAGNNGLYLLFWTPIVVIPSATISPGSNLMTGVASTAGIIVGQLINTDLDNGHLLTPTFVTAINSVTHTITMSQNAAVSSTTTEEFTVSNQVGSGVGNQAASATLTDFYTITGNVAGSSYMTPGNTFATSSYINTHQYQVTGTSGTPINTVTSSPAWAGGNTTGTYQAYTSSPVTIAANTVATSNLLSNASTTVGITNGQLVVGTGIPTGTTVTSIFGSTITISGNATTSTPQSSITFSTGVGTNPNLTNVQVGQYVNITGQTGFSAGNTGVFMVSAVDPVAETFTVTNPNGVVESSKSTAVAGAISFYAASPTTAAQIQTYVATNLPQYISATLVNDGGTSGAGIIALSTYDDSAFAYKSVQLQDGINWISVSNLGGSPQFTFKLPLAYPYDGPANDWYAFNNGETVQLVPTTMDQVSLFSSVLAVSGFITAGTINVADRGTRLELATQMVGSVGAIQIVGGLGNGYGIPILGSATRVDNSLMSVNVNSIAAVGALSDQWFRLAATNVQLKETLFSSNTSVSIIANEPTTGSSTIQLSGRTLTQRYFGKPRNFVRVQGDTFRIENQGSLVCLSWTNVGTNPLFQTSLSFNDSAGGTVTVSETVPSSDYMAYTINTGVANFTTLSIGDLITINVAGFNAANNGTFLVTGVSQNGTIIEVLNPIGVPQSSISFSSGNFSAIGMVSEGDSLMIGSPFNVLNQSPPGGFKVIRRLNNSVWFENPNAIEEEVSLPYNPVNLGFDGTTQFSVNATNNSLFLQWSGVGAEPTLGTTVAGDILTLGTDFSSGNRGSFMVVDSGPKLQEIVNFTFPPGTQFSPSGAGQYFLLNSAGNVNQYYVWFNVTGGSNTDPAPVGLTGLEVTILSSDSSSSVANKASAVIAAANGGLDFTTSVTANVVTVTTTGYIQTTSPSSITMPPAFIIAILQAGQRTFVEAINPSATNQSGVTISNLLQDNRPQIQFLEYSATVPGDTFVITSNNFTTPNIGPWTISKVLDQNTIVVTGVLNPVSNVSLNNITSSVYVQEGVPYYGYKKIVFATPQPGSSVQTILTLDTNAQSDQINQSALVQMTALNKLKFNTIIELGLDSYSYNTGLIAECNKIIYGDPTDNITYPGIGAAGAPIFIRGPLATRIQVGVAIRLATGVPFTQTAAQVVNVVTSLVNANPVGKSIAISSIVAAVSAIPGIIAVSITSPSYDTAHDQIVLTPGEKAFIINPQTDISVVQVGV
jgi:uncharacterized phage protein gp47/JayE